MGKDKDERKKKDKISKSDKKEKKHRKEKHKKDSKDKHKEKEKHHRKDHVVSSSNVSDGSSNTVPQLTADDFYIRHEEFRVWLHLKERCFEDLSSEQAHQVFDEEFIKQFNKGKLPSMFYPQTQIPGGSVNGIPTELREAAMKTKHKWNLKVTDRDRQQQEQVSGEVSRKTRVNTDNAWVHMAPVPVTEPSRCTTSAVAAATTYSGSSSSSSSSSSQSKPQATQQSQHFARQKAAAAEYLDNYGSGRGSDRREAAMQKRDTVGQKIHAASR